MKSLCPLAKPQACLQFIVLLSLLWLLAGCAAKQQSAGPVFWPTPPDEPRIQYLTGISTGEDLGGRSELGLIAFGSSGSRVAVIEKPYGLAVGDNRIYVSDTPSGQVWVIDLAARTMTELPGNYSLGKLKKPTNLTLDSEGNLYVADTGRREVLVYNREGQFLRSFGPRQGHIMKPVDVAVSGARLYVCDIENHRILALDRKDGRLLETLVGDRQELAERVYIPTAIAVDSEGVVHVINSGNGRLIKLDADGHVLSAYGGLGKNLGTFARPRGLAVDEQGRIFITDAGHGNCQIFDKDNRLLIFFGDPGLPEGSMVLPAAVAATRHNLDYFRKYAHPDFEIEELIYVINQYSRKAKVAVYGLGHMKGWSQPGLEESSPGSQDAPPAKEAVDGSGTKQ